VLSEYGYVGGSMQLLVDIGIGPSGRRMSGSPTTGSATTRLNSGRFRKHSPALGTPMVARMLEFRKKADLKSVKPQCILQPDAIADVVLNFIHDDRLGGPGARCGLDRGVATGSQRRDGPSAAGSQGSTVDQNWAKDLDEEARLVYKRS